MPLKEKQRWEWDTRRPNYAVYKKRRRSGLLVLVLLATLVVVGLGAYFFASVFEGTGDGSSQRLDTPAVEEAPKETAVKEQADEEKVAAPDDPTLYLTVPRLGIYGHTVRNDRSEAAMDLGAIKLPSTGFPWQKGANTYIACHRLGWPGNESFHQCLNLPSMQKGDEVILEDANGTLYRYRVSEFLQVTSDDTWVTGPVEGRQMISLQTCIESFNDFATLGPNWSVRFIVRADRVG